MTFALLKNEDKIVRVVGERSLDNTYTIMENYLEKYNPEKTKVINQTEVEVLDSNTNLLEIELRHRHEKHNLALQINLSI